MDLTPYKNCLALTNSIFIANEEKPYRPCCWFRTQIDAVDVDDYRKQLSEMDLEYNCDYCIKQDQGGTYSYRQQFDKPKELILTVSFDNICNLKCVTCNPSNSSQLIQEMFINGNETFGGYDKKYYTQIQKQAPKKIEFIKTTLATNTFETIRFDVLGGEPLINPAIFEFIDWLSEQPYANKTMISFTTNGTTYNDKIEEYLKKFSNVIIQLSIDGVNEQYEYLRYGNDFSTLETVCDKFYALTNTYNNFHVGANYTLSWMNALHFADFFVWAQTRYPKWNMYVTKLEMPEFFSIDILSRDMRLSIYNKACEKLGVVLDEKFRRCLFLFREHMLSTTHDKYDEKALLVGLGVLTNKDKIRGTNRHIFKDILDFIGYKHKRHTEKNYDE